MFSPPRRVERLIDQLERVGAGAVPVNDLPLRSVDQRNFHPMPTAGPWILTS